jgi:hypothetical protein
VLSGRGLCDGPIPRPEESYRLWCVFECDQVKINILDTCCEFFSLVQCLCCQVEVSATGRSLVQRSPTDCVVWVWSSENKQPRQLLWIFFSCTVFLLSGRGLCDGPIPRPEESYRLWCVSECDQVKINSTGAPQSESFLCSPVTKMTIFFVLYQVMEHRWNEIDRGKRKYSVEKPVPSSLSPPKILHRLAQDRTRASTVGGRRLTAWAMAPPFRSVYVIWHLWKWNKWSNAAYWKAVSVSLVCVLTSVQLRRLTF